MTIRAVADTHAILWYLYNDPRLSVTATNLMDTIDKANDQLAISSVTLAEIVYLVEKGKIHATSFERVVTTLSRANTSLVEIPFDRSIADTMRKIERSQIPEFPDRIIAATSLLLSVPLISRDHKIQASIVTTIW
jgi:PIN domain nuclease of toxin-antitoxin system